jgi:AraC-like DNA-binding protein
MNSAAFFTDTDPLGEYRWRDVAGREAAAGEAVWAYGGPASRPTAQLLAPHWKVCLGVVRRWAPGTGALEDCRLLLLGPVTAPRMSANLPGTEIVALRLHPELVPALLGIAASDIADSEVGLPAHPNFDALRRLGEVGADQATIAQALLGWLARALPAPDATPVRAAAQLVRRSGGRIGIARLAERLDVSPRTLRRQMQAEVGLPAKAYARSVRLKRLLMESNTEREPDWAQLALAHGYADQSHMLRELRAMTGMSARRIHAMRTGLAPAGAVPDPR